MKKPEMILFDYGDTLLREPDFDLARGERAVFKHVVRNPRGLTPEAMSRFESELYRSFEPFRRAGYEPHEYQLLRLKYEYHGIGLDVSIPEAEVILWDAASPLSERCLAPHVKEMLARLRREGIRTGVISHIGWSGSALRRRVDRLLPEHRFEFVLASSTYGVRKPDARLFELALRKAELPAGRVWYCGNSFDHDVRGAANAGLHPVWYRGLRAEGGGASDARYGEGVAHSTIDDWNDLAALIERCG